MLADSAIALHWQAGSASLLQSFSAATNAIEGAQLDLVGPCSPESPSPLSKDGLAAAVKGLTANSTHVLLVCADTAGDVTEEMDMFASLTVSVSAGVFRPRLAIIHSLLKSAFLRPSWTVWSAPTW